MKFANVDELLSLKIVFILTNSADPDEISGSALFAKVPVLGIHVYKGSLDNFEFVV